MLPAVAIVGRPNVGKSTLFNALTRSRDALVADVAGLTRDRIYGVCRLGTRAFAVIDTAGLGETTDAVARLAIEQAREAVSEADLIALVTDARAGPNAEDQRIADELRRRGKSAILVVNKVDGLDPDLATLEFHALGIEPMVAVSATHRRGLDALVAQVLARTPDSPPPEGAREDGIRVAVVGRPNVGKSTLVNRLAGQARVVAHDQPGTTRDSVSVPFERDGRRFVLIDTAGVRRRARVTDLIERFSVLKTLAAVEQCQVAVVMLDAAAGLSEQDAHLLGLVLDSQRAVVIALNKWDGLSASERRRVRAELDRRLKFAEFATLRPISALHGSGLGELLADVVDAHRAAGARLSTPELSRVLQAAVERTPPPMVRGRRVKLRYAHQGGVHPPRIVVHGNQTAALPEHYRRYLIGVFRQAFGLRGTPIALELRTGSNPYQGRRNPLSPRQQRKRKRLLQRAKRRRS